MKWAINPPKNLRAGEYGGSGASPRNTPYAGFTKNAAVACADADSEA